MATNHIDYVHDGVYLAAVAIDPPRWGYPFRNNLDRVSAHFEQDYLQSKLTFVPQELKIAHPTMPTFYLINETQPVEFLQGSGLWRFTRTWARIPESQTIPGSRFITKPDLPGTFPQVSGNSLIVQPEENVPRWIFYTQIPVTSDSGVPDGSRPTGGTWTVTIGSSTTGALAYNISVASLQTALNALTSVSTYGTITVTPSIVDPANGQVLGFNITFNAFTAATLNTAGMVIFGGGSPQYTNSTVNVVNKRNMNFRISAPNTYAIDNSSTFTITIFGQTTAAIPVTGTSATVKTALEALSNIGVGNVTVSPGVGSPPFTGTNLLDNSSSAVGFGIAISSTVQSVTTSAASLLPFGSTAGVTQITGDPARDYVIRLLGLALETRTLYAAAHGIAVTDGIVLTQGAAFQTLAAGTFSVSTDTIVLTSASGAAFTTNTVITAVGKASGSTYTAGTKLTRIKRVTDFYLPGVSSGVSTIDDIPLPDWEGDDASLLAAIFSGDTDINYEVGELEYYRDGPIVQRTRTTLNAATL